jgi:acyl-CoA hydrolase
MDTHRLVLPADLNPRGFLFGGRLLAWVDEASWIAATLDFPGCNFVTIGMDTVEFHHSVREGTILRFESSLERKGTTSVTYFLQVVVETGGPHPIFSTRITFVNVDDTGYKQTIPA